MPPRAYEIGSSGSGLAVSFEDSELEVLQPKFYSCGINLRVATKSESKNAYQEIKPAVGGSKLEIPSHRYSEDSGVYTATPGALSPRTSVGDDDLDSLVFDASESVYFTSRFGRYKINESVQSGVSAVVHAAYDYYTGEKVALKIIKSTEPSYDYRSAEHECWVHQHVDSHPNIAKLVGMSVQSGGQIAIVTEYVGPDLFDVLNHRDWRITQKEFLGYARQLASAIAHMHSLGFAHRDIKPENVCTLENGKVKLIDFGVARHVNERSHVRRQAGTHGFMAPEQLVLTNAPLDLLATDVWALGITFFNILTGGLPFGDAADFDREFRVYARGLHLRSKRKARAWRSLTPALRALIEGMLSIDVYERWTMPEVVAYLDALAADADSTPPLPSRLNSTSTASKTAASSFTNAWNAFNMKKWWRQNQQRSAR